MSETTATPQERDVRKLLELADELRPATQALLQFVVQGAELSLRLGGAEDEVWATVTVTAAQGLGLDLSNQAHLLATGAIAELVMERAQAKR